MAEPEALRAVLVVGAGLLGASVGLALRHRGVDVVLLDVDPDTSRRASELGAGADCPLTPEALAQPVDLAVVAVPPEATADLVAQVIEAGGAAAVTDVASVKSRPQRELENLVQDTSRYVGGHPMAGRERSGPTAARADLFVGRPWVLTPSAASAPAAVSRVRRLAQLCGAVPVVMTAREHDRAVAIVSHAPHVLASLVAARLLDADAGARALCGQGIRDVTRIAASDPPLWQGILAHNAEPVRAVLEAVRADLDAVIGGLAADEGGAGEPVLDALNRGVQGRRLIPGKHGEAPTTYANVPVVVTDRPGQLARLFADAGAAGVNVEDVRIDHARGQPLGVVELAVAPLAAATLVDGLRGRGWTVHPVVTARR
jgi:prephenate dehydrogenase